MHSNANHSLPHVLLCAGLAATLALPAWAGGFRPGRSSNPNKAAYFRTLEDQAKLHARMRQTTQGHANKPPERDGAASSQAGTGACGAWPGLTNAARQVRALLKPGLALCLLVMDPPAAASLGLRAVDTCPAGPERPITPWSPAWSTPFATPEATGAEALDLPPWPSARALAGTLPREAAALDLLDLIGQGQREVPGPEKRVLTFSVRVIAVGQDGVRGYLSIEDPHHDFTLSGQVRAVTVTEVDAWGAPLALMIDGDSALGDGTRFRCALSWPDSDSDPLPGMGLTLEGGPRDLALPLAPIRGCLSLDYIGPSTEPEA